nr:hypothetical protein [Nocardia terpenica]
MSVQYELRGVEYPGQSRSIWRFGDPECPLRLAETPTGLGGAPLEHVRQSNARQRGATYRGTNLEINPITLVVRIGPVTPGTNALAIWNEWRTSLGTGSELAEFHVFSPSGGDRWQWVRLEKAVADPPLHQLQDIGWMTEQVALASDDSDWNAAPVTPPDFTPETFDGNSIHNAGDVDSWPYWELTGPGKFTIGVDGEQITLPALAAGEVWTIETDPEYPHIRNADGDDKWPLAGNIHWYRKVPARSTVALNLSGIGTSGASRIKVVLPQRYQRAVA